MLVGQFWMRGRAEAAIFLAFRPWMLIPLMLWAMRRPWRERWTCYLLALSAAAAAEALLVLLLGAPRPWSEALRGIGAGLAVAAALDLIGLACAHAQGVVGRLAAAAAGLALFAIPGALRPYDAIVVRPDPAPSAIRSPLLLLTGLPLLWGERSEPAPAAAGIVAHDFALRPIDALTPQTLSGAKLALIAQPRPPGPEGLVELDAWVRRGGRALILSDPELRWPSAWPLGDPRRPPAYDGLGPLLTHWGLVLQSDNAGLESRDLARGRRVVLAHAGRFAGKRCRLSEGGLLADCRVGRGRAILLADADLLHDLLWTGPGPLGAARAGRLADNPALVVDLLRDLDGMPPRSESIAWITRPDSRLPAIGAALAPPALLLLLAMLSRRRPFGA